MWLHRTVAAASPAMPHRAAPGRPGISGRHVTSQMFITPPAIPPACIQVLLQATLVPGATTSAPSLQLAVMQQWPHRLVINLQ